MAKGSKEDAVPPLEWAAAAIGLLVAVALLGLIGREALGGSGDELPVLEVRLLGIEPAGTGCVAQFEVANRSGRTAAAVQVEGKAGGEQSQAAIDYVPGHSRARGGLVFSGKPGRKPVEVRVTGFQLP